MPCYDAGPGPEWLAEEKKRIDGAVIGLCRACSIIRNHDILPPELQRWHDAHLAVDEQKLNLESAQASFQEFCTDMEAKNLKVTMSHPARRQLMAARAELDRLTALERLAQIALADL